ncbi:MAG TPA: hypothetical protein DIT64_07990 [Verrucomicrobiales bacterium]|nr:hypothetical protein [Verrucomicrobiales bacterium]
MAGGRVLPGTSRTTVAGGLSGAGDAGRGSRACRVITSRRLVRFSWGTSDQPSTSSGRLTRWEMRGRTAGRSARPEGSGAAASTTPPSRLVRARWERSSSRWTSTRARGTGLPRRRSSQARSGPPRCAKKRLCDWLTTVMLVTFTVEAKMRVTLVMDSPMLV